jgi:aminobenzoyl-glutamate utilization protein B
VRRTCVSSSTVLILAVVTTLGAAPGQQPMPAPSPTQDNSKVETSKRDASVEVEGMKDFTQQTVDMLFSFAEVGFQEVETSKYIVDILRKNGFTVQEGISGMPTAWVASWGSGKPVIALTADLDCLPQASQKPGVAYHDPIIAGAPGHGEGHNAGPAVILTAALAVKKIMQRDKLSGTLQLIPGIGNESLGGKAWFVRDGVFKDVDVVLRSHVGANFGVSWGNSGGLAILGIEYDFKGEAAHASSAPWRGHSALDAVELMDVGWNFRREHLRLEQRSHSVILDGGDQPNVVPATASSWYFFRETDHQRVLDLWGIGNSIAQGAAMMTGTSVSWHILGAAAPEHNNKPVALTMYENIQKVGLPQWSEADQTLAKALQTETQVPVTGLAMKIPPLRGEVTEATRPNSGGGDDIGDVSWTVPTVTLSYPSNIPGAPGHTWASSVAMATPIAHKGATAGAKVVAMTTLDLLLKPEVVRDAWDYFRNVQTKDHKYVSFITAADPPATFLNRNVMTQYRDRMRRFYYDPTKYKTYLEQLGIKYPTLRNTPGGAQ